MSLLRRFQFHVAAALGAIVLFAGGSAVGVAFGQHEAAIAAPTAEVRNRPDRTPSVRPRQATATAAAASASPSPAAPGAGTPTALPAPRLVATPTGANRTSEAGPAARTATPRATATAKPQATRKPVAATPVPTQRSLTGTVIEVRPNGLVLRNAAGREISVNLVPNYTLKLNGKAAAPSAVQVGDQATVLGRMAGGRMEAGVVLVRRR